MTDVSPELQQKGIVWINNLRVAIDAFNQRKQLKSQTYGDRALQLLNSNPQGLRYSDLGKRIEIGNNTLSRCIRRHLQSGKIVKVGILYYSKKYAPKQNHD